MDPIEIDNMSDNSYYTEEETTRIYDFNIYCINLRSRPDRKIKMVSRFNHRKLIDKVIFIEAVTKRADLLRYYTNDYEGSDVDPNEINYGEIACFASHLKALRTFLENTSDTNECAIICEDDILIHNNFSDELEAVMHDLPIDFNICSLSYFPVDKREYLKVTENIYQMGLDNIWGTQMYLISREYALNCIFWYDRPNFGITGRTDGTNGSDSEAEDSEDSSVEKDRLTSEIILRKSLGYLIKRMLAIEECEDSDIRDTTEGFPEHSLAFCKMDYEDYSEGEADQGCILKSMLKYRIKKLIKYRQTDKGLKIAKKLLDSIKNNKLNISLYDYSRVIDEYFINLYYINIDMCKDNIKGYLEIMRGEEFRKMFEENPDQLDHINANLEFVGLRI